MIKSFFIALGLLTRIPVPSKFYITESDHEKMYGWSVLFYPLVGLIIGAVLVLTSWGLSFIVLPGHGLIEAAVLLTVWVLITGALHLDGLADSADAWLGGYGDPQRTLEIMKDPCSGPAAVVVLILVLLLKFVCLIEINWMVLLLAPVLARTAVMVLLATTPYVRAGGMAETVVKNISKTGIWSVLLLIIVISAFILIQFSWILLILFIISFLLRQLMLNRISGVTGDTAGAFLEIVEVSVLVVSAGLFNDV